jgi:(2Fe-2S) ferredoxin
VLVEPDHIVYADVKLSDVEAIVDAASRGETVERLVARAPSPAK